jgi:hypothetical protein
VLQDSLERRSKHDLSVSLIVAFRNATATAAAAAAVVVVVVVVVADDDDEASKSKSKAKQAVAACGTRAFDATLFRVFASGCLWYVTYGIFARPGHHTPLRTYHLQYHPPPLFCRAADALVSVVAPQVDHFLLLVCCTILSCPCLFISYMVQYLPVV